MPPHGSAWRRPGSSCRWIGWPWCITYANGDQVDYTDIVFRCTWVSGDPHPADGELTEVGFYDLAAMGDVDDAHVRRIALAMAEDDPAHFRGGRVKR